MVTNAHAPGLVYKYHGCLDYGFEESGTGKR